MTESGWAVEPRSVPVELEPDYHHELYASVLTPAEERAWTILESLEPGLYAQIMERLDNNEE